MLTEIKQRFKGRGKMAANKREQEIDRLINLILNSTVEDYPGDAKRNNECWEELGKIDCAFSYASNYDYNSTKDGILKVLLHLKDLK